jgi:hypothetical protein
VFDRRGARLAQSADSLARDAPADIQRRWLAILEESAGDSVVAQVIKLIGDGLYSVASGRPKNSSISCRPAPTG